MSDRNERSARCRFRVTGEGDLLAAKSRLVAEHGASATLALQAVAHRDARWFALNCKLKLSAAAGGVSGHGVGSVALIWVECRLDPLCTPKWLPCFPIRVITGEADIPK
jgi:hypothetical protein